LVASKRTKNLSEEFRSSNESGVPMSFRFQLVQLIIDRMAPIAIDDICRYFDLNDKKSRMAIKLRLKRLQNQGVLLKDIKERYGIAKEINLVVGRVSGNANGYGFLVMDNGEQDIYLHHKQMRKVLHGDHVLARVKSIDNRGRKKGEIIEVLITTSSQERKIIGYYHYENGLGFVEPDDSRFGRNISIPKDRSYGAMEGDIVVVKIIGHPIQWNHAVGEVVEVLGKVMEPGIETQIAIKKFEIPSEWSDAVRSQLHIISRQLSKVSPRKERRDLRNLKLVTIDGIDARDFDDAVYCEPSTYGWRLLVAIADVSHYVTAGSPLDTEALNRGNSIYFPNTVVPMLPQELSNGICSLHPKQDRYCVVCDMEINQEGEVITYEFYSAVMHSYARLTYEITNAIVYQKDTQQRAAWSEIVPHLDDLYQLYCCLDRRRRDRGTVEFEFPEPFIEFDSKYRISRISVKSKNIAYKVIEECMLAANVCAAQFLKENIRQGNIQGETIYRNHEGPRTDVLVNLRKFLSSLGLTLEGGDEPKVEHYADLVNLVSDKPEISSIVQSMLLRSLGQAIYSTKGNGHFALAFPIYTHFTSPIRRYSDLVIHRQIKSVISKSPKAEASLSNVDIAEVAKHCSYTERRAEDATRDVIVWLKAQYMQDKVGKEFEGVISSVKEFGIFVQLNEIFVDGLVHVKSLGNDYYHFDPLHFQLIGERTAQRYRLGDAVKVVVARVDLFDSKIDLELATKGHSKIRKTTVLKRRKNDKQTKQKAKKSKK